MNNNDKYDLIINFINKLIKNKAKVIVHGNSKWSFFEVVVVDSNLSLERMLDELRFRDSSGAYMSIIMSSDQQIEISYKFNKLKEIAEEKALTILLSI